VEKTTTQRTPRVSVAREKRMREGWREGGRFLELLTEVFHASCLVGLSLELGLELPHLGLGLQQGLRLLFGGKFMLLPRVGSLELELFLFLLAFFRRQGRLFASRVRFIQSLTRIIELVGKASVLAFFLRQELLELLDSLLGVPPCVGFLREAAFEGDNGGFEPLPREGRVGRQMHSARCL